MNLAKAVETYQVQGLDKAALANQDDAFQRCIKFLSDIEKIKTINTKHQTGWLKHTIENPRGKFGRKNDFPKYGGNIYEGTLILAAYASGFTVSYSSSFGLRAGLNISERSLKKKILSL